MYVLLKLRYTSNRSWNTPSRWHWEGMIKNFAKESEPKISVIWFQGKIENDQEYHELLLETNYDFSENEWKRIAECELKLGTKHEVMALLGALEKGRLY